MKTLILALFLTSLSSQAFVFGKKKCTLSLYKEGQNIDEKALKLKKNFSPVGFSLEDNSNDYQVIGKLTKSRLLAVKEIFVDYTVDETDYDKVIIATKPKNRWTFVKSFKLPREYQLKVNCQ